MNKDRLARLRVFLQENGADAIIINKEVNLHYFSGFRGDDTALLISAERAILVTDFRYVEQAAAEAPLFEIAEQKAGLWQQVASCVKQFGWRKLAFEGNALFYADHDKIKSLLPNAMLDIPLDLGGLRMIKEPEEIVCLRKAAQIADAAFSDILKFLRPGISEVSVAARLEMTMRNLGAERPAFPTIVASGRRGSLPHGIATEKLIVVGEFVTMDFGAVYQGYHSDMTRTVCVGQADVRQREIYDIVLQAQLLGVSKVRPGRSGKAVDAAVRQYLADSGYGENFRHGLGHSLGLEIHEEPRLSPFSICERLEPNMLITVEPGVYIVGWGGLRIEDTVLITHQGCEPLTISNKNLIEIL